MTKPSITIYQALLNAGFSESYANGKGVRLAKDPTIKKHIDKFRAPIVKKELTNREELVSINLEIARDDRSRAGDRIKATEIVAKMLGLNEPEQINVAHQVLKLPKEKQIQMAIIMLEEEGYRVIEPGEVIDV